MTNKKLLLRLVWLKRTLNLYPIQNPAGIEEYNIITPLNVYSTKDFPIFWCSCSNKQSYMINTIRPGKLSGKFVLWTLFEFDCMSKLLENIEIWIDLKYEIGIQSGIELVFFLNATVLLEDQSVLELL